MQRREISNESALASACYNTLIFTGIGVVTVGLWLAKVAISIFAAKPSDSHVKIGYVIFTPNRPVKGENLFV